MGEFLDDAELLLDRDLKAFLELWESAFLLIHVLDESSSSVLHLSESGCQPDVVGRLQFLSVLDLLG